MTIERAFNTNVIELSEVPTSITSVSAKVGTAKFFTNINSYKLVDKTITLQRAYKEIKVDYTVAIKAEYDPKVAKDAMNFAITNFGKINPVDLITQTAAIAQSKRTSVEGSTSTDVGQVLSGFKTLTKNPTQNKTVTDNPITGLITDAVPGITVTQTSNEKANISILTGTTIVDGLLNATIVSANPKGIKSALINVIGASENSTKAAIQEASAVPDKVVQASTEDISKTVTADAKATIKKANRVLGNPLGSGNPFGSLGNSFGNILGAIVGKIQGLKSIEKFGDTLSGVPEGFIVPEGYQKPADVIEADGSSNVSSVVKPSNNASENIRDNSQVKVIGSNVALWKGAATPISTGEYVFEIVDTSEELEAELRNTTRDISTAVVHWSKTHSNTSITAQELHTLHLAGQTAALDGDLIKLIDQGVVNGLEWHYVIQRNGLLQRGRPLDIEGGTGVPFVPNTIHIGFIAGYTAAFGTPNSELTLSSASITSAQWKSFDKFVETFYKAKPGGEILGHKEVDKAASGPGFDVSIYVAGKYKKSTIYTNPHELAQPLTPAEQINRLPIKIKSPVATTIEEQPDPAKLAVADVDNTKSDTVLDSYANSYDKKSRELISLQREVASDKLSLEQLENEPGADRLKLIASVKNNTIRINAKRKELNQFRKDLINGGYKYDQKTNSWSTS